MKIKSFVVGIAGANLYLITNEKTKETIAIDPGGNLKKIDDYIEENGLILKAILLTHGHFDHIMGIEEMKKHGEVPVYIAEPDLELLEDGDKNLSTMFVNEGFVYQGATSLQDGAIIKEAGFTLELIETPGHTEGSSCYYLKEEGVLFSGDTLFRASVGRTDLVGGSDKIGPSIKEKLFVLPDETVVYPGHGGATTIGYEKKNNPYV